MIYSFNQEGFEGSIVEVRTWLDRGKGHTSISGILESFIRNMIERVKGAIKSSGFVYPKRNIYVHLNPEDVRKSGMHYDLPVAISILAEHYTLNTNENVFCAGELSLENGNVLNSVDLNAGLRKAKEENIQYAIIPDEKEVIIPEGILVCRVKNLKQAFTVYAKLMEGKIEDFTEGKLIEEPFAVEFDDMHDNRFSLDDIKGDNVEGIKFALAVAVAGRHNVLFYGSPGSGRSSVPSYIWQITPLLLPEERKTVDRIYKMANVSFTRRYDLRPLRYPDCTASIESMCGGGASARPGEISLSHNGTLFLDEAGEFRTSVLQMLRVPLDRGNITLSRAGRSEVLPADFQLVMSSNPCHCGNFKDPERMCLCSAKSIKDYWAKFSAPLLDRIAVRWNTNIKDKGWERLTVKEIQEMVKRAWEKQYKRQNKLNEKLTMDELTQYAKFTPKAEEAIQKWTSSRTLSYSDRRVLNLRRISLTIADMLGSDAVSSYHVDQAIELSMDTPEGDL